MIRQLGRLFATIGIVLLTVSSMAWTATCSAATITMSLTDFDVTYLGNANQTGAIFDAMSINGANGSFDTTNSDELQAASFSLGGVFKGTVVDTPDPPGPGNTAD